MLDQIFDLLPSPTPIRIVTLLCTFSRLRFLVSFCVAPPELHIACHGQDRCARTNFPGEESCCHMVGDAVLFQNREIKPSVELSGLPEEVGKVIQWRVFVSSLCYY